MGSSAGSWWVLPWVGTETHSWCLVLSALPQQKHACATSAPGLLYEAVEDGEISTRKTLLFLLHMTLHPSGAPLPSLQQQTSLCQPWKQTVHPSRNTSRGR